MIEELSKIIEDLKKVSEETGVLPSHDVLFSESTDIFIAQMIESNKDKRTDEINKRGNEPKMASSAQKDFLGKLGFKGDMSKLTSSDAYHLIKELKDKKDKKSDNEGII